MKDPSPSRQLFTEMEPLFSTTKMSVKGFNVITVASICEGNYWHQNDVFFRSQCHWWESIPQNIQSKWDCQMHSWLPVRHSPQVSSLKLQQSSQNIRIYIFLSDVTCNGCPPGKYKNGCHRVLLVAVGTAGTSTTGRSVLVRRLSLGYPTIKTYIWLLNFMTTKRSFLLKTWNNRQSTNIIALRSTPQGSWAALHLSLCLCPVSVLTHKILTGLPHYAAP